MANAIKVKVIEEISITSKDIKSHKILRDKVSYELNNSKIIQVEFEEHNHLIKTLCNDDINLFEYERELSREQHQNIVSSNLFKSITLMRDHKFEEVSSQYYYLMYDVIRLLDASITLKKVLAQDLYDIMNYNTFSKDEFYLVTESNFFNITNRIKRKLDVLMMTISDLLNIDYYFVRKYVLEIE